MELTPELFGKIVLGIFIALVVGPALFWRKKKRRPPRNPTPYGRRPPRDHARRRRR